MNSRNLSTFCCKQCRHYRSYKKGGEFCKLLFVPVQGTLIGCSFYVQQNPHISTYNSLPYTHAMAPQLGDNLLNQAQ